ncbi:MAG: MBL fold metallo-hydrolase [Paludibacteraceae bacterium]|nr:MBL fold metallo-hydrolase [Paludibacteraceae bacterium]
MVNIKTFVCNPYQQNTYVVHKAGECTCFIVDAGIYSPDEEHALTEYIRRQELTVEAILITHSHPDHVCGLKRLQTLYPDAAVYRISTETENETQNDAPERQSMQDAKGNPEGVILRFTHSKVQIFHTPGHKEDCVCYYLPDEGILFSGDTLFYGSVGRTDLPGGDYVTLIESLHLLMKLPADTKVYSGHGEPTTIGHEKQFNPFIH